MRGRKRLVGVSLTVGPAYAAKQTLIVPPKQRERGRHASHAAPVELMFVCIFKPFKVRHNSSPCGPLAVGPPVFLPTALPNMRLF